MSTAADSKKGHFLVIAAAVLWGTTGTAQAFAPAGASPATVGAVRLVVGGLALMGLALASGALHRGQRWPPLATTLAAGCMAGYQVFFFSGVARTGVAVGTIVAIGSAPMLAGAFGWLARGERPEHRWGMATLLAVLGCTLLVAGGGELTVDLLGVLLALGAGACYALYTVISKGLLDTHPSHAVMAVIFCLGALLLSPLLFLGDLSWLVQPAGLSVALHLGLVASAAAYALFGRGLKRVPVTTAVTLSLAEPLTAGLLGMFVLGEQLSALAWLGIVLLLGGLVVLTVFR